MAGEEARRESGVGTRAQQKIRINIGGGGGVETTAITGRIPWLQNCQILTSLSENNE